MGWVNNFDTFGTESHHHCYNEYSRNSFKRIKIKRMLFMKISSGNQSVRNKKIFGMVWIGIRLCIMQEKRKP